jgi:hypothetical protein
MKTFASASSMGAKWSLMSLMTRCMYCHSALSDLDKPGIRHCLWVVECDAGQRMDVLDPLCDLGLQPCLLRFLVHSNEAANIASAFLVPKVEPAEGCLGSSHVGWRAYKDVLCQLRAVSARGSEPVK